MPASSMIYGLDDKPPCPRAVVLALQHVLTMFGLIAAVDVRQFAKADLSSDRNLFVIGFAIFMGLSISFYFSDYSTGQQDIAWLPESLRKMVSSVEKTGMAIAAILGILLDNLIPGTLEERGLAEGPGVLVPEGADVDRE